MSSVISISSDSRPYCLAGMTERDLHSRNNAPLGLPATYNRFAGACLQKLLVKSLIYLAGVAGLSPARHIKACDDVGSRSRPTKPAAIQPFCRTGVPLQTLRASFAVPDDRCVVTTETQAEREAPESENPRRVRLARRELVQHVRDVEGARVLHRLARQSIEPVTSKCHSACNIGSDAILGQLRLFCAD